ncbi:MAG: TonB-dependent receptor plug domain-containing protein [Steroidobacteraceae bacterium]
MKTSDVRIRNARRAATLGALVLAVTFAPHAFAQSTVGSIYGDAQTAGDTITITSQQTGLTRTVTAGADGKFTFPQLPVGTYAVTENNNGASVGNPQVVSVSAGMGSAVSFSAKVEEIVVTGSSLISPIDVSTAQVSLSYTAEQLQQLPVPKDVTGVALLAPGTVRGTASADAGADGRTYASLASFGGSGISENTYYINGFNVTNLYQNTSYAQLPWAAIASEQVITGGYGPEYGMATGGVLSVQTKKGTNTWQVGGQITWDPDSLRSSSPRTYSKGNADEASSPYQDYSKDSDGAARYDLWAGGAIIPDKLFIYAAAEFSKEDVTNYPNSYYGGNVQSKTTKKPFGLVNIDWNINDRNVLELTGIQDETKDSTAVYQGEPDAAGWYQKGSYSGTDYVKTGGWIGIAKYTSNITDDLSLSLQYGQMHSDNEEYIIQADGTKVTYNGVLGDLNQSGCPAVTYTPTWTAAHPDAAVPNCYTTGNVGIPNGLDTRKAGRADVSYKLDLPLSLFAQHTFSAGYDFDHWSSFAGESRVGGASYSYYSGTCSASSSGCNLYTTADPYVGDYVRATVFQTSAEGSVHSSSFYLKDDIQVTKNLLLQLGVRNDSFDNINGAGQTYVEQKNIWQPRLGFAWDMSGDAKSKLYGSYGIYTNPITAGVAVRGASASLYCRQFWTYTDIDSVTGHPTLGTALSDGKYCFNGETGETPAAGTFASSTLSPTKNQEFILGFQQTVADGWTAGIRATYRNLLSTIDDYCDFRGFYAWAEDNGVGTDGLDSYIAKYGAAPCFIVNPGQSNTLRFDVTGSGALTTMKVTPAEMGLPAAKRRYLGVDLTLEKAWNDKYYAQFSYTWSHNYGNTEGTSNSDNSQTDIGTTLNFDYPQIMEGAFGDLPNDHRHTFKILGAYRVASEWVMGGNFTLQTGKPINCIGFDQDADAADNDLGGGGYGAVYHYCNGQLVPRGTVGRTPTLVNIDLAASYSPRFAPGLTGQISVFNVLNRSTVIGVDEYGEDDGGNALGSYLTASAYQPPRYVELSVKYQLDFGK